MLTRFTARSTSQTFLAALVLSATAACASDTERTTEPTAGATTARGSSPAPSVLVGGTWTTTLAASGSADSTQWSLFLSQRDDKLEGSLISTVWVAGKGFTGVSAIKRGSIAGQSVSLEFDRGEGAETATTFNATVSGDARSMTGFHSRRTEEITLVRR